MKKMGDGRAAILPPNPTSLQSPPLSSLLLVAKATGKGQKTKMRRAKCADEELSQLKSSGGFVAAVTAWQRCLTEGHANLFQKPKEFDEITRANRSAVWTSLKM